MRKMIANKELLLREIAGEYILIPVGETALKIHGMISLSESGCLLWKRIQTEATEEELVEVILNEYEIDPEMALNDVKEFVEKMEQIGIVNIIKGDNNEK